MNLNKILQLMATKYPCDGIQTPVLLIFDDGSGWIVDGAGIRPCDYPNPLFEFSTVEELVKHLEGE